MSPFAPNHSTESVSSNTRFHRPFGGLGLPARLESSMYNIDTEVFSNTDQSNEINYYIFNVLNTLTPNLDPKLLLYKSLTKFLIENCPIRKNGNGEDIPQI